MRPPAVLLLLAALAACSAQTPSELQFEARDGKLLANGKEFRIKGINWFGSESGPWPPFGLDHNSIDFYLKFLADNGFNAVRLLFNHQSVLEDEPVGAPASEPELFETTCAPALPATAAAG